MKRENNAMEGITKEFKNGNINIKLSADGIETIKSGKESDLFIISELLFWVDTYFVGDQFCLSNYDMGVMLYNNNIDKCYIMSFSDIEKILLKGHTLKLYSYEPSEDDRQTIEYYL